jgi:nucleotide-binding universal stress UspA family protein
MFAKILVPLDGSSLAEAILPEVEELATLHDAEVMLLRVALAHAIPLVDPTDAQVHAVEEAEGYLADVNRRLAPRGIKVSRAVRYGNAADEILDHARARHANLIAMSTHGRSGLRRLVMGSVAEAVLRASPVPVLLLRAKEAAPAHTPARAGEVAGAVQPQPAEVAPPTIRHIMCPVDFFHTSESAMVYAGALAERFHADLTVLHVVYDPLDITCSHIPHPPLEQLRDEMIREAEQLLGRQVRRELRFLPRVKTAVVTGPPFAQITRYAREHHVDLIVMGTHGGSGLDHLVMGSTAERVVRVAPCPVLTIHAAA